MQAAGWLPNRIRPDRRVYHVAKVQRALGNVQNDNLATVLLRR